MTNRRSIPLLAHRGSGILLHLTSLPGSYGIGDLGPEARHFVDLLCQARQTCWQMLPLTPPGEGDSPYQSYSAFAGNGLVISPDDLLNDGLVGAEDLAGGRFNTSCVDFPRVRTFKQRLLEKAWLNFRAGLAPALRRPFKQFLQQQSAWLNDYALFVAIRDTQGGESWQRWPRELMRRSPRALDAARRQLADAIERESFTQFLFARQITALKRYANAHGIRLVGDLPIFVSAESADVWTHPHLFKLDRHHWPKVIAGVPPDAFSRTGQLWGNPLYDWRAMKREGYAWWIARMRSVLRQCDIVRIDHFRGFAAAWEVPADAADATPGKWVKGPGEEFFSALRKALGTLPMIAEDLGLITPDVIALREKCALPGMRVLHFAFDGGPDNPHLPHNYSRNTVAYTGTHDNDTTAGWYRKLSRRTKSRVHMQLNDPEKNPSRLLMRAAWQSVAAVAIAPLQDVLNLSSSARMNTPGTAKGNWGWRVRSDQLQPDAMQWLRELTDMTERSKSPRSSRFSVFLRSAGK